MQRTSYRVGMLCANEKPATCFQGNVLALLDGLWWSDHTFHEGTNGRTLTNIEFMLSRKALDEEELFSMGDGALWVRWISKAIIECVYATESCRKLPWVADAPRNTPATRPWMGLLAVARFLFL